MIKVNLQNRKSAVGVTTGSATGSTGDLRSILERLRSAGGSGLTGDAKTAALTTAVLAILLAAGWWWVSDQKAQLLAAVAAESAQVTSELDLLNSEIGKTAGYEQIKKGLEADEAAIRTKISTIQELIRDRSSPPKILMTLSETIPKDVWLQEFTLKDRHFRILGSSMNIDVVSDFMKSLEETIYFKSVVLKSSKQDPGLGGALSASFELEAERR